MTYSNAGNEEVNDPLCEMGAANDLPLAARLARLWRPSGSTRHRRRPGRAGVRSGLKPARQRVLSYIATVAVKGACARPQGGPARAAGRGALRPGRVRTP